MSTEFPTLAEVLSTHSVERRCSYIDSREKRDDQWWECMECFWRSERYDIWGVDWDAVRRRLTAQHHADAWRDACTITTVEQLDSLPVGSIALDDTGEVLVLSDITGGWSMAGCDGLHLPILPALLIHHPDWSK